MIMSFYFLRNASSSELADDDISTLGVFLRSSQTTTKGPNRVSAKGNVSAMYSTISQAVVE